MSVSVNIIVLEQPYGNPGSLGEPLGIWYGAADVTGDATGGFVACAFEPQNPTTTPTLPDQRRTRVYFCDGVQIKPKGAADPGNMAIMVKSHWARANSALNEGMELTVLRNAQSDGNNWFPSGVLRVPNMERMPIFWDTEDMSLSSNEHLVDLRIENNNNLQQTAFRAYGRFYDKAILANRAFGRLIQPASITQFAG